MKRYFSILTLLVFTISCQTVVDIELPDKDSKLTLNSYASTDSVWSFALSASKGILEPGSLEYVTNGSIVISGSDGSEEVLNQGALNPNTMNYSYRGLQKPKAGVRYSVVATAPGFLPVSANDTVPEMIPIERIDTFSYNNFGIRLIEFRITFTDPQKQNFYDLKLYSLTEIPADTTFGIPAFTILNEVPYFKSTDSFFGGGISGTSFDDALFNGKKYTLAVGTDAYSLGFYEGDSIGVSKFEPQFIVELRSVSSSYFKYQQSYSKYQSSSFDPFAQPVQVYNNVEGGFGIFAPYSSYRDTL